jgi:predicted kinase
MAETGGSERVERAPSSAPSYSSSAAAVVALCGLPGCGKSTLARGIRDELSAARAADVEVVSFDDALAAEARGSREQGREGGEGPALWSPELWHASRRHAFDRIEGLLRPSGPKGAAAAAEASAGSTAAAASASSTASRTRIIIADDNAWLRSMRRHTYKLARDGER